MPAKQLIGLIISAILLYIILSTINIENLKDILTDFGAIYFILFSIIYLTTFYFRALRWRAITAPMANITPGDSLKILLVSYSINFLTPARLGELIRAYLLGKKAQIGLTAALTTILMDRLLDGIVMIALLLVAEPLSDSKLPHIHEILEVIGVLLALILAFILIPTKRLVKIRQPIKSVPSSFKGRFTCVMRDLRLSGQAILTYPSNIIILSTSILAWLIEAAFFYLIIWRVGIEVNFPAAIIVLLILNIGLLLPATPGYIGTYEAFVVLALLSYGAGETEAAAVALIAHVIQYVSVVISGLISLKFLGVDYKEILNFKVREQQW